MMIALLVQVLVLKSINRLSSMCIGYMPCYAVFEINQSVLNVLILPLSIVPVLTER